MFPAIESGEIVDSRSTPTKAVILFKLPAGYTEEARAAMIRGTVLLRAVLRSSGVVSDIEVQSGLAGGLTEQSIEATRAIVFIPAMKDGAPVSTRLIVEYNFSIY
ncbi:MAG: energy transducer TonB [Pyrinomonadaceae bacterium]